MKRVLLLSVLTLTACGTKLPSTVVQLEGRNVEIVETGSGGPTVVFEAGLGNDWTTWDAVAREVSQHARVFAYSRPGYGKSARSEDPRTAKQITEDLRALLAARQFAPPYILVGHSFGGAYMEYFAKAHPEEIAGVVLVDPRHRDFGAKCDEAGISGCGIPAAALPTMPKVERDEVEAYAHVSEEINAAGKFGAYPVRVLTAKVHGFNRDAWSLWESLHGELASEAADGKQVFFPGVGHGIQDERPREVATIILELVNQKCGSAR